MANHPRPDVNEDYARLLLDCIPHIVWTTDRHGVTNYLNRIGQEHYQISVEGFSGWSWLDLVHPDDRERARQEWLTTIDSPARYRNEYRVVEPDGSTRWMLAQAVRLHADDGTPSGWVGTWTDVEDLKRAEDEIRRSNAQFQQIADNIDDVFWFTDSEHGRTIYASRAYERIWGRSPDELYSNPLTWIEALHPDDRDRVLEAFQKRKATGEYDEQYRIVRPDGTVRWIRDRTFPVRSPDGTVARIAGLAEDITERLELETGLSEAQRVEALGLLAGGIAHDFNNILTAIRGNAELALAELAIDSPAREEVRGILDSASRATALTRQLLTFSRREMVEARPVCVPVVLRDIEPMLRRLIPTSIALDIAADDQRAITIIDPGQLEQVVMNLVINARDAMPNGGTIRIVVTRDEHSVILTVTDTGIGMNAETQTRAFKPLFTTKPKGEGTGLGLFTLKRIVDAAGGLVDIESELGTGTTFRIRLPAASNAHADSLHAQRPRTAAAAANNEAILVVEDEVAVAGIVKKILERAGYRVSVAADGVVALDRIRSGAFKPDLVITDIVMPRMMGHELVDRLSRLGVDVPVLFLSGYSPSESGQAPIPERARFLEKPFSPAELLTEIRELLGD